MQKTAKLELIELKEQAELPEIVARLLSQGLTAEQMARRFRITRKSLDTYLRLYGRRIERVPNLVGIE